MHTNKLRGQIHQRFLARPAGVHWPATWSGVPHRQSAGWPSHARNTPSFDCCANHAHRWRVSLDGLGRKGVANRTLAEQVARGVVQLLP